MINLEQEAEKKEILIRDGIKKIHYDENTELFVKIFRAFTNDDRDLLNPYYGPNYYFIKAWIDDTKEYGTKVVKGFKGCYFTVNQTMVIPLNFPAEYLYLELLRGYSWRDPGTSNGTVVMGRAKIELPPPTSQGEIPGDVDLVGISSNDRCLEKKGRLEYSMKLHKYVVL